MRIGVYPFASTNSIKDNLFVIKKAIRLAAENQVRLLVFHECALTGYPLMETKIEEIRRDEVENALSEIAALAKECGLFVAVGTVRFEEDKRFNSVVVFDENGNRMGCYDKKALWGWDTDNFAAGDRLGLFRVDDVNVGFRICFDVRFPEPFRELYKENADICFVSFSDTSEKPLPNRYEIIKSHLRTRAVENVMTVVSVNSIAGCQTAPTAVFDCNGNLAKEAEPNVEALLVYDYAKPAVSFGMKGRIVNSNAFLKISDSSREE